MRHKTSERDIKNNKKFVLDSAKSLRYTTALLVTTDVVAINVKHPSQVHTQLKSIREVAKMKRLAQSRFLFSVLKKGGGLCKFRTLTIEE